MVVILMGADAGAVAVARTLANELDWPLFTAREPHALHGTVARVLGRREHLIVTTAPLGPDEQQAVRGDLHLVRFVDLSVPPADPDDSVGAIRREFGI